MLLQNGRGTALRAALSSLPPIRRESNSCPRDECVPLVRHRGNKREVLRVVFEPRAGRPVSR
jgi:hypothetical protein